MTITLKASNFYHYAFYPEAPELSFKEKKIALIMTIAMGVFTLGVGHLVCGVILLYKKIKNSFKCEDKVKQLIDVQLIKTSEISRLGLTDIIHELCEIDVEGNYRPCRIERIKEILSILKDKNALHVLNSIPKYIDDNSYKCSLYESPSPCYTPLQHWASQGDIEAVKAFVQAGASDFCKDNIETHCDKSALYVAALHGHKEIVQYLLKNGAKANIAFHNNVLTSFVPQFIYEISCKNVITNDQLACLEIILNHLCKVDRENLTFQLQIPIDFFDRKGIYLNIFDFLNNYQPPNYQKAKVLLLKFGAESSKVFSLKKLRTLGLSVGTGFTLHERSSFK